MNDEMRGNSDISSEWATRQLLTFCCTLELEQVPSAILESMKLQFLDTLGVMLVGSTTENSRAVMRVMGAMGGKPESTVAGYNTVRLPSPLAAFVNGASAHSIELDGGHEGSNIHPQAAIFPAALAVAESTGASGREMLLASLIGFEISLRMGLAIFPSHMRRGFHTTATCGTFGAAAASARLMGLGTEQVEAALTLAATQAMGLRGDPGSGRSATMKRIHAGKACHNGILASLLAKEGIPAADGAIFGPRGFLQLFSEGPDYEKLLRGLGSKFVTERSYLKPYSACRHIHAPIASALALRERHSIDPAKVRRVEVKIYREGANYNTQEPMTTNHAQFSVPYGVAIALLDGKALLSQYTPERLADPAVRALMKKVEVSFDPEMDRQFVETKKRAHILRVEMENGDSWTESTDYPKGSWRNPMSQAEVEEKYLDLATRIINRERALSLKDAVARLERLESVSEIVRCLPLQDREGHQ